jgi:hypothetical protein
MTTANCMGCDMTFNSPNNTKILCSKCKKMARDMYIADGGTREEFIDELTLLKGAERD